MHTDIISILFIAVCILFIFISGCINDSTAREPDREGSADTKILSSTDKESSCILTRDKIPLRYATYGQGPPVVFVLGYGMTIDEWPHKMISHLAQSHRVIVYNHRGVSGVKNPEVPFTIPQAAMDLQDVIIHMGGGDNGCKDTDGRLYSFRSLIPDKVNCTPLPVDIVGYSMGGMIALEYAKEYPDSVNHLILLNTDCGGAEKVPAEDWVVEEMSVTLNNTKEYLDRAGRLLLTESFRNTHPDPLTWFADYGEVADPGAVQEQYDSFLMWEGVYEYLPSISCKTLIITGDQDIVIPPENAEILADAIPNATLLIRQGQAHGMIFMEPDEIAKIIEEFLE